MGAALRKSGSRRTSRASCCPGRLYREVAPSSELRPPQLAVPAPLYSQQRVMGGAPVMLEFVGAPGGSLRGADYDQKHSCWSCYPHSLHFCRFGGAPDSSSPRDECICRYALWSLRLRISQEGLRARAARRRVRDSALGRRANVPAVLVSLCASKVRRVVVVVEPIRQPALRSSQWWRGCSPWRPVWCSKIDRPSACWRCRQVRYSSPRFASSPTLSTRGREPPTEAASIQKTAQLLDDLSQIVGVLR
jgi:hypothetical protein